MRYGGRPAVALVALMAVTLGSSTAASAAKRPAAKHAAKARLASVHNCTELRAYEHAQYLQDRAVLPVRQERRASDPPLPVVLASGAAQEISETNVQEAGVDEPDTVKARAGIVFSLSHGVLHAIDARDGATRHVGRLLLPGVWRAEMVLHGERLLVLAQGRYGPVAPGGGFTTGTSSLIEIDVRQSSAMRIVRTLEFEGEYLSARRQGAVVRVVLSTPPAPVVLPAPAEGQPYMTPEELQRAGAEALATAGPSRLMPDATLRDARSGATHRFVPGCQRVRYPREFAGLDLLTVLTLDLERGIEPVDMDAVLASGDEVYASHDSLYVVTQRFGWNRLAPSELNTRIHRFETGPEARTVYRSSGSVRGDVLNQFALSEHEGHLRVATTMPAQWTGGTQSTVSESFVTVLADRGDELVRIGRVGGLGHNENIRGVRFIGDSGYVVTFRQTDPLYVVDLSDPRDPRVKGELKIPGYSAYLHPVGDGRLLGVGRDGDAAGRLSGAQVSLFDVSDPARPRRIDRLTASLMSTSAVEWDHHAFLWSERRRLAIVPLHNYGGGFNGVVGIRVDHDGLSEIGRLDHETEAAAQRSLIVGDRLLSFSRTQVVTGRVSDLTRLGSLPLDEVWSR